MNILVTNDDGILAPGLALLADVCREVGNVTVVAPDREQSGTSHSLTLHRPLRPARRPDGAWQVDGTPTDCVMLAVQALMPERPDFVFSGINHGPNMGEDVLYSGTVAAAMEAVTLGVPGIGDLVRRPSARDHEHLPRRCWSQLVRHITAVPDFPGADPAQHQPAQGPGLRGARDPGHQAGQPLLLGVAHADEGSVGHGRSSGSAAAPSPGPARRTPITWPWLRATSPSRRSIWTSRIIRCSKRSRDGRWRAREGDSYGGYRSRLVETLQAKGIRDLAVLRAIGTVPRHLFVPESVRHRAYEDTALPIGGGQTISQPWVQARYLELAALTGRERVLEIGAGSGYQTALLAPLADAVFAVERIPALAQSARAALAAAGVRNVTVLVGDGTLGWRPFAPYDAILVAAASPEIPAPLVEQLAPGGRLIIPLGDRGSRSSPSHSARAIRCAPTPWPTSASSPFSDSSGSLR